MEGVPSRPAETTPPSQEPRENPEKDSPAWQPHDPEALEEHGAETIRRVFEILEQRKRGKRDNSVVAVMIGPGAMRASQSAAILAAMVKRGLQSHVDLWLGSSAGAHNAAYAATGRYEAARMGYVGALAAKRSFHDRFVNVLRWFLRRGPVANLELIRKIYPEKGEVPFDWPELLRLSREGRLGFIVTNEFGDSEILTGFDSPEEVMTALMASSYIPGLYDAEPGKINPPKVRGKPYFDGGIAGFLPVEQIQKFIASYILRKQQTLEDQPTRLPVTGNEGVSLLSRADIPEALLLIIQGSTVDYLKPPKMDTLMQRVLWRIGMLLKDFLHKIGHGSFSLAKIYPGVAARLEALDLWWARDVKDLRTAINTPGQDIGKVRGHPQLLLPNGDTLPLPLRVGLLTLPRGFRGVTSQETNAIRLYNVMLEVLHRSFKYIGKSGEQEEVEKALNMSLKEPLPPMIVFETQEGGFYGFPIPGTAPWERTPIPTKHELESGNYPSRPPHPHVYPTRETVAKAREWTQQAGLDPDNTRTILEYLSEKQRTSMSAYPRALWESWLKVQNKSPEASPTSAWRNWWRERVGTWFSAEAQSAIKLHNEEQVQ